MMHVRTGKANKFLDQLVAHHQSYSRLRILDVGCGLGDSAIYLASLGHQVMGISNQESEITAAKTNARRSGADNCMFETMDARDLNKKFTRGIFDAIVVSNMLHLMGKDDSTATLQAVKDLTIPNGYNAIRGYVVDPQESVSPPNIERMFRPSELSDTYDADPNWRVLSYDEEDFIATTYKGDELVGSHAEIIAQKCLAPRRA